MAKFTIKALVVTALVCLVFDLAASDNSQQHQQNEDVHQQTVGYVDKDTSSETTPTPSTFKDKFKGFVSSVKEGASDALDKLDEKRKEAVAGTKKLVNGAIDKIKHSYDSIKNGNSEENTPRSPESSSEEHVKNAAKDAKDAVIDKTQNFMKSEKTN
ncbi:uncharacterized protein LOC114132852 isoform X1 [Aphis gossypii]|uniref:Uncharacterized protein n=1 Tax=Aphis gossypii TaxID=80765 RepID=A0A9P0IPZ1_APHGO|nr:uncharacterized protein LOC114132852 isoform X1 [Aphis gossypii]CAH1709006.1 unnamed protein product [Aphis gossypii]